MAKYYRGPDGVSLGRIGNKVTYIRLGKIVTRTIGVVTSWSPLQKEVQMRMKLVGEFLKPVKDVLEIGFKNAEKPDQTWSNHNLAVSLNTPQAIKGTYPNLELDYSKLVLSKGTIPQPKNLKTELNNDAIKFSWDADLQADDADADDQLMCVVYFPEKNQAFKVISGAKRTARELLFKLPTFKKKLKIETFVCFVSDDHKNVSDTVYGGQLIWDNNSNHELPAKPSTVATTAINQIAEFAIAATTATQSREKARHEPRLLFWEREPQKEFLKFVTYKTKEKVFTETIGNLLSAQWAQEIQPVDTLLEFGFNDPIFDRMATPWE